MRRGCYTQGWIQHDLVGGGGGAHFFRGPYLKKFSRKNFFRRATTSSRRRQLFREKMFLDEYVAFVFQWLYLSINLLHYCEVWFDYSIWIVIVVHSLLIIMLLLKLLNLILSLIIFCFIMKNSTPCTPWPGLGGVHPPPPHTPSKSIPGLTPSFWSAHNCVLY